MGRLWDVYLRRGLISSICTGLQTLRGKLFDLRQGVHTTKLVRIETLITDWRECHDYFPTEAATFARLIKTANITPAQESFMDIGSGMGRILMLAHEMGFREVQGVEISESLNAIAGNNLARCVKGDAPIKLMQGDAATIEMPQSVSVFYLYNPCKGSRLRQTMANIRVSIAQRPRQAWVLFNNTAHIKDLEEELDWLVPHARFTAEHECAVYNVRLPGVKGDREGQTSSTA
ncbi:class I SAM-dependent methyltransferase [Hoeflea poritis]|uniref:Class I SAM-dependent methyltransferase n=1 Tax=Hoeflea poritis TaxID=2993659 RepID=A0ABT4VM53_9HYPH|nr:class I SAM-dependent methyltransferase [Hoeflea poritis]MDA4845235.1 class I SAM-dependent methyltransferase [Hoeflea poritis]